MVVLVAVVGLLSTVGAAALGGYWTNKSVEREFEAQRSAEIQDQRREVYVDYLRAASEACLTSQSTTYEATTVDVLNHQGQVMLIAGENLRDAVGSFTAAILSGEACSPDAFNAFRDAFIEGAQPDLE